jgi:hypothetical protein
MFRLQGTTIIRLHVLEIYTWLQLYALLYGQWALPQVNDADVCGFFDVSPALARQLKSVKVHPKAGASGPVWRGLEISPPRGFDARTIQYVASCFTD